MIRMALLFCAVLFGSPAAAHAQCIMFGDPAQAFADADTVFRGTVRSTRPTGVLGEHVTVEIATFTVDRMWKGSPAREIEVGGDRPFSVGTTYIVFAGGQSLTTSLLCRWAEPEAQAGSKLAWLSGKVPESRPSQRVRGAIQTRQPRIGVGNTSGGRTCVATPYELLTGEAVTLVSPNQPHRHIVATVVGLVEPCGVMAKAQLVGRLHYQLQTRGLSPDDGGLWIAFAGNLGIRRLPSGAAEIRLSAAVPRAQVRSCSSSDWLHLSVWDGVPLKSRRIWDEFYYLGIDVEPECQEADVE